MQLDASMIMMFDYCVCRLLPEMLVWLQICWRFLWKDHVQLAVCAPCGARYPSKMAYRRTLGNSHWTDHSRRTQGRESAWYRRYEEKIRKVSNLMGTMIFFWDPFVVLRFVWRLPIVLNLVPGVRNTKIGSYLEAETTNMINQMH